MYEYKEKDIVEEILGESNEIDESISNISDEEFISSIKETKNNLREDLKKLKISRTEAMRKAMRDGLVIK